jgi:hypothetical protein
VRSVTRLMNDPLSPSDEVNPERNLYHIATAVAASSPANGAMPAQPAATSTSLDPVLLRLATRAYSFAVPLKCDPPRLDASRWEGFPVQRCAYTDVGVTVRTDMLNPSVDQLARWTVSACNAVAPGREEPCIAKVAKQVREASSGVFPVEGFLPEPASSGGGSGAGAVCYLFRDGVTISTGQIDSPRARDGLCPAFDFAKDPPKAAKRFGRVASTTREEYLSNGGRLPVGTPLDLLWSDTVRVVYQAAWGRDDNELITAKARTLMR